MAKGTIFKFHNDLDTDQIIASQYLLLPNLEEMKEHAFESLDPDFPKKVKPGDFVVGGENFGCGSSREQAPGVLKALGVQAIVAKSFATFHVRWNCPGKWQDLFLHQAAGIHAEYFKPGRTDRLIKP